MRKKIVVIMLAIFIMLITMGAEGGCFGTEADIVSANLSTDAEQFKINRRAVFYNGITGEYMLTMEGRLSIEDDGNQLEVTVKVADDAYKKHFLGLSDNISYFVEQLETADVDRYRYKVIFRPQQVIPDFDIDAGSDAN